MPVYRDGDDITGFTTRFERIANLMAIPNDQLAIYYASLLTGKALNIYTALSVEITRNYQTLKAAMFEGFNKTSDTYRLEFRSMKIGPDETYSQFVTQLSRVLDRWINSKNVTNFEELMNFFIIDQFLSSVSNDLRIFLKEQRIDSLTEMTSAATGQLHIRLIQKLEIVLTKLTC